MNDIKKSFIKTFEESKGKFRIFCILLSMFSMTSGDKEISPGIFLGFEKNPQETEKFENLVKYILKNNESIKAIKFYQKYLKKKISSEYVGAIIPSIRLGIRSGNKIQNAHPYLRMEYDLIRSISGGYDISTEKANLISVEYGEFVEKILKLSSEAVESAAQYYMAKKYLRILDSVIAFYEKICSNTRLEGSSYIYSRAQILKIRSHLASKKMDQVKWMQNVKNAESRFKDITGNSPSKVILFDLDIEQLSDDKIIYFAKRNSFYLKKAKANYNSAVSRINSEVLRRSNISSSVGLSNHYKNGKSHSEMDVNISFGLFDAALYSDTAASQKKSEKEKYLSIVKDALTSAQSAFSDYLFSKERLNFARQYADAAYSAYVQERAMFDTGGSTLNELIKIVDEYLRAYGDLNEAYVKFLSSKIRCYVEIFGLNNIVKKSAKIQKNSHSSNKLENSDLQNKKISSKFLSQIDKYNKRLINKTKNKK